MTYLLKYTEAPQRSDDMMTTWKTAARRRDRSSDAAPTAFIPRSPDLPWTHLKPQISSFAPGAYGSLMKGMLAIWTGPPDTVPTKGEEQRGDILGAFRRERFHWDRA